MNNHLANAIDSAERQFDWNIKLNELGQQEIGQGRLTTYELLIEGQWAEEDAEDFFSTFKPMFYCVGKEFSEHSFCTLIVEVESAI